MSLASGARLGPYEITAKLGEGGMGVVWKARDFHLGRDVALKVLPEGFANDPERLQRFEREAKLLAQLNHPSIAQIHGLEIQGDTRALVMELVEGPTLAERLEHGPLPFNESLSVSLQIAQALEEAHEKGIVHRDLKPQNVKASIEGKVKVLDFGLAKAMDPTGAASGVGAGSTSQLAQSPTLTLGATQMGVILGTAAYMSPEQAKGLAVDKRADIWAFGVVLFEMLSGRRLFEGDTVPETLAGVIRAEIDLSKLPGTTPPSIRRLLERCLERDPKRRLRDIGEARLVLERPIETAESPATGAGQGRRRWTLAAVALGAALLGALAVWVARPRPAPASRATAVRSHLLPPDSGRYSSFDGPLVLSPDGTRLALRLDHEGGRSEIAVRALDSFDVRPLPDTDDRYEPSWSPDGRSILYFSDWLWRADAAGIQPAQKLAPIRDGRGASWAPDGTILFAPDPAGVIHRVSAAGGEVSKVTELDPSRGELAHLRPQWLPDNRHFVYLIRSEKEENRGIFLGSIDGKVKRRLLAIDRAVRFAPPDFLLAIQDERLVVRRIDLAKLEIVGDGWTIADGVEYIPQFDSPTVSASRDRLVFHVRSGPPVRQLARIDRTGKLLEDLGDLGDSNLDLSPDGMHLATSRTDEQGQSAVWIRDLARGTASRLSAEAITLGPVWSPDGRSVAYASNSPTGMQLLVRPATGGEARKVWSDPYLGEPIDWSPDGETLLVETGAPAQATNLTLVPARGDGAPQTFVATAADEQSGRFSPDGRWIAYVSNESGSNQIFVQPFPQTGARYLVSPRAGNSPRWAGGGAELLYVEQDERNGPSTLMSVSVKVSGAEIAFGAAQAVGSVPGTDYEPGVGGKELFVSRIVADARLPPPVLIDNWTALLEPR